MPDPSEAVAAPVENGGYVWKVGGTGVSFPSDDIPDSAIAHFDASELSLSDGEEVTNWPDESDNNHNLAGSGPTFVSDGINGNPAVDFDGIDDYLEVDGDILSHPITWYIVIKFRQKDDRNYVIDGYTDDSSVRNTFEGEPHDSSENVRMWAGNTDLSDFAVFTTSPTIYGAFYDTTNSKLRQDGADVDTGRDIGSQDHHLLTVGSQVGGGRNLDALVGEVIGYDRRLNAEDTDQIEQYLGDKWGLTI